MATETDFRLDVAARLVTELQDRYRLPGETWDLAFDGDAEGHLDVMSDEDALRRIRGMLDDEAERAGVIDFLKETVEGYITDDAAEEDWRIARAALTLLRGREGDPQRPIERNKGLRGTFRALEAFKSLGGWRGLDAEAAVEAFASFCDSEARDGFTVLRHVGSTALVFTGEGAPQPYVVAHGYDEKSGEWGWGSYYGSAAAAWNDIDPDVVEESVVWWSRSDFEQAVEKAGMEVCEETVDEVIDGTCRMRGWRDLATSHGWEGIKDVLADIEKRI